VNCPTPKSLLRNPLACLSDGGENREGEKLKHDALTISEQTEI
jgi:hypothetical protein